MTIITNTAVDSRPRPRTPVAAIGTRAVAHQVWIMTVRGLLTFRRNPQLLFDAVALPIITPVLIGGIFGNAIAGSTQAYLPVLIPGVLVQIVLTASVTTGVQLCEDANSGVHERFLTMPIARLTPIAGLLTAGIVRYVIAASTLLIVGYLMGYRPLYPLLLVAGACLVVVVTAAMSWIFAAVGLRFSRPSAVQGVSAILLTLFTLASNALVPDSTMPRWLAAISDVNPVSHLVSAVRLLTETGRFGADAWWSLCGACVVVMIFVPVTLRAMRRH
ncbi:ABC transporter permease [Nocardia takedensis]|uniref:ABC transporter permease n=1 Tax=Nocardia takedensis TaxID=259390 RepID=UPI0002D42B5E|nr:ABC transporter permease [Nocardia takedensis]